MGLLLGGVYFAAAFNVSRIQVERSLSSVLAAFIYAAFSEGCTRDCNTMPLASPLGNGGLPTFGFFSRILYLRCYRCFDCRLWRVNGRDL